MVGKKTETKRKEKSEKKTKKQPVGIEALFVGGSIHENFTIFNVEAQRSASERVCNRF